MNSEESESIPAQSPPLAEISGHLSSSVEAAFSANGALALSESGYSPRAVQIEMALAVARAIEQRDALVVEAGTGVGKTFAYLVPVLLSGRRALISTATKSLQDQLFFRDLPRLRKALGLPIRVALLKGRSSYLCRHRLALARQDAQLPDRNAVRTLVRIENWAQATSNGDLAELEGLDERSNVLPLITSTRDNCLGSECPEFQTCHVMHARREALAADVVVVNHHLFFADMALRDTGVAELLPSVDVAVFDEAHQMVEAGVGFLGRSLGSGQLSEFGRDVLAAGLAHARGLAPWVELVTDCEQSIKDLKLEAMGAGAEWRGNSKRRWDEASASGELATRLRALQASLSSLGGILEALSGAAPDFARLRGRAAELAALAQVFCSPVAADKVRWVEGSTHQVRLVESPLDIRALMADQRATGTRAWVFTSATLGDDEELSWFCEAAGLEDAHKLRLGSPFDYPEHARLYVPPRFPAPTEAGHAVMVGRAAAHCAQALGGRTFVLTTTLRALQVVAEALKSEIQTLGGNLKVLVQGSGAKRLLLERFLRGGSVLVGSQSFWEGIDVPGDALQCVIIDKLPFPPPNDPLVEARVNLLKQQGRDAFNDYFVAEAAIALKQGAGRLIRTESDRGLLVICDVRLIQARYGARLLRALPAMSPLNNGAEALSWLSSLATA